jgi:hypothetical protein
VTGKDKGLKNRRTKRKRKTCARTVAHVTGQDSPQRLLTKEKRRAAAARPWWLGSRTGSRYNSCSTQRVYGQDWK